MSTSENKIKTYNPEFVKQIHEKIVSMSNETPPTKPPKDWTAREVITHYITDINKLIAKGHTADVICKRLGEMGFKVNVNTFKAYVSAANKKPEYDENGVLVVKARRPKKGAAKRSPKPAVNSANVQGSKVAEQPVVINQAQQAPVNN
jgi:hypothetical protein